MRFLIWAPTCMMVLSVVMPSFASIPTSVHPTSVEQILSLPIHERILSLKKIGPDSYRDLRKMAFDEKRPYEIRWRAVLAMAYVGKKESVKDLEMAFKSPDWFLRDAALKGILKVDQKKGRVWARELMTDPALVIRSAAVQTLRDLRDKDSEALLWAQLHSPQNFRGKQSLWVRRQIAETLSDFTSNPKKLATILKDEDPSLYPSTVKGLERLTGKKMNPELAVARQQWLKIYQ